MARARQDRASANSPRASAVAQRTAAERAARPRKPRTSELCQADDDAVTASASRSWHISWRACSTSFAIRSQERDGNICGERPSTGASASSVIPRRRFASARNDLASFVASASFAKRTRLLEMQRISSALPRSRAARNAVTSRLKLHEVPSRIERFTWHGPNSPPAYRAIEATASALRR
jgi:hypothetical protein